MEKKRDRLFFDALVKLGRYIEENFEEEGFLPAETKMSEMFGVSGGTLRTVLAAFARNSVITSYHRRGHYVLPKRFRTRKIGLVIDSGKESPFLSGGGMIGPLVQRLEQKWIFSQMIQSSLPENLLGRALAHGVQALVWVNPPDELLAQIGAPETRDMLPQLVVSNRGNKEALSETGVPYLVNSPRKHLERKLAFLAERGHQNILSFERLADGQGRPFPCVRKLKVNSELVLSVHDKNWEEKLAEWAEAGAFTAILASVSFFNQEKILRALNRRPNAFQPEVLLHSDRMLSCFRKNYPRARIVGHDVFNATAVGEVGAEQILGLLERGKALKSQELDPYWLKSLD